MSDDPVIDRSHVDNYLRSRHRVEVLNAAWKPALAGAAGAMAIIGAVVVGVWVATPRFTYREVVIDHVVPRDVPFDNHIPHDKPFDNYIPRLVTPPPIAANPPKADAPKTPAEQKFHDKPEYKDATYHGRIVKSRDGHVLSFEDGQDFHPAHWDDATGKVAYDPDQVIPSDEFVGDLGMCVPNKAHDGMWDCTAMHKGQEVHVSGDDGGRPVGPQSSIGSTPVDMVNVDVDVGGYPVTATVDTGCSWPMSMPSVLADTLVNRGLAIRAGSAKTTFADGIKHGVDIVLIKTITVHGRILHDVEASVIPHGALTLLGLGALNRLGAFKFEAGRIVFTSERPT